MEPVNKSGKKRGRRKNRKKTLRAPSDGLPAVHNGRREQLDFILDMQGPSALHMACLYGQLETVQSLLGSRPEWVHSRDQQGRRPLHMVLSSLSSPNTLSCVRYLLEHGADVNVPTDSGVTPLHLAASEGFTDSAEILLQAGADASAQDSMGLTPLDLSRIFCHREVARHLRSSLWQREKDRELKERRLVQTLYRDLVDMVKLNDLSNKKLLDEKVAVWANKKGFPLLKDFASQVQESKFHTKCLSSDQYRSTPAFSPRPWTIFTGFQSERPPREEPDLRGSVSLWKDSRNLPQYNTKWDNTSRSAPDLPLDVLKRVLFPRAFPPRITSPRHFEPQGIREVQRRGQPQGRSTSPWTEVVMHLVEELEFGHY